MVTIQEIRQKYPQYSDLSDDQLAGSLYKKHYSDMDFGEFSQRIGLQAQPEEESIGAFEDVAKAIPSAIAKGVVKAPLWLADTMNAATQGAARLGGLAYMELGGELTPEQARALDAYQPFYGSQEVVIDPLSKAGVDFYEPKTTAGQIADIGGEIVGYAGAERAFRKGLQGLPKIIGEASKQGLKKAEGAIKTIPAPKKEDVPKAFKKVYDRLRADFPDDAEFATALNSYMSKKGQSLVEKGGQRVANLAEGSAMYPSGGAMAGEFFKGAIDKAPAQLKTVVNKAISPKTSYFDELEDIVRIGREKANPIYKTAYKSNQSVQSPVIDRILRTDVGKAALETARRRMDTKMSLMARPDPELTAIAKDLEKLGKVTGSTQGGVASGLKLQTLDQVKRAMDRMINSAVRQGDDALTADLTTLKKGLVKELDRLDKTGAYAKARKVSGDYITNKQALEQGARFLNDDADVIANMYKGFGATEKASYKVGVVRSIRNKIDKTTDGGNVSRIFNNENTRQKLQTVLNKNEYSTLLNKAKEVDNLYRLRNQITGNSRTAMRKIAAEEFDEAGKQLVSDLATRGYRDVAIDKVVGFIASKFDGLSDKTAREVAEILYETDPKKKYQIVKKLTEIAKKGSGADKQTAIQKLGAFFKMSDETAKAGERGITQSGDENVPLIKRLMRDESGSTTAPLAAGGAGLAGAMTQEAEANEPPVTVPSQPVSTQERSVFDALNLPQNQTDVPQYRQSAFDVLDQLSNDMAIDTLVKENEGLRLGTYQDTEGLPTVGYGLNLDSGIAGKVFKMSGVSRNKSLKDVKSGKETLTPEEANALYQTSIKIASDDARRYFSGFDKLSQNQKMGLIDMSYQLGLPRLKKFSGLHKALKQGDKNAIISSIRNSEYGKKYQNRAQKVIKLLTS